MRKAFVIFAAFVIGFLLTGCDLPGGKPKPGALQVNSVPTATVFIDGKHVGRTPHYDDNLEPGEYIVKLISEAEGVKSSVWSGKVKITSNTLTLITRELSDDEDKIAGEVMTLDPISNKKEAQLAIVTNIDEVTVKLNGEFKGKTPLVLTGLTEGSSEAELVLDGYVTRRIQFKLANGYRLTIDADLAKSDEKDIKKDEGSKEGVVEKDKNVNDEEKVSSSAGEVNNGEVDDGKLSVGDEVKIVETGTGWLRVRAEASLSASESAKVDVGAEFTVIEVDGDWVRIEYEDGEQGWVFADYVEKI